jgi:hypothetical protein
MKIPSANATAAPFAYRKGAVDLMLVPGRWYRP